jgi:hypothetical protein
VRVCVGAVESHNPGASTVATSCPSEAYGHLPNDDGTFNDRQMDRFLAGADPQHRTLLITAAGKTAGFVMTLPAEDGGNSISGFFVVRALRRTGVGLTRA